MIELSFNFHSNMKWFIGASHLIRKTLYLLRNYVLSIYFISFSSLKKKKGQRNLCNRVLPSQIFNLDWIDISKELTTFLNVEPNQLKFKFWAIIYSSNHQSSIMRIITIKIKNYTDNTLCCWSSYEINDVRSDVWYNSCFLYPYQICYKVLNLFFIIFLKKKIIYFFSYVYHIFVCLLLAGRK